MSIVEEGEQVLSITRNGFGKRTEIDEYRVQSRGGKGIKAMNLTEKTGLLAGQLLVDEDEDILLITDDGTVIRTPVSSISTHGRNTQGVRIMRVEEGSQVVCVAPAEAEEDEEGEAELPPLEDAEELSAETDETDETEAQPEGEDDDISRFTDIEWRVAGGREEVASDALCIAKLRKAWYNSNRKAREA